MKRIYLLILILAFFVRLAEAQNCPQGTVQYAFAPTKTVQVIACKQTEVSLGKQSVFWGVKNLTNDKLYVKFVKVVYTTCGKVLKSNGDTYLKPGEFVGGTTFAGEITFETQVWKEDCNAAKNRIERIAYENLTVRNISEEERKKEQQTNTVKNNQTSLPSKNINTQANSANNAQRQQAQQQRQQQAQQDRQREINRQLNLLSQKSQAQANVASSLLSGLSSILNNKRANDAKKYIAEDNESRNRQFDELKRKLANGNGKLVDCTSCYGEGYTDCNSCGGDGTKQCSSCYGKGGETCPVCKGSGKGAFNMACTYCFGKGTKDCLICGNSGKQICNACNGLGKRFCSSCKGTGQKFEYVEASYTEDSNANDNAANNTVTSYNEAGSANTVETPESLFAKGLELAEAKNYVAALKYYMRAADGGHLGAMNNIGVLYQNGQGVQKNITTAASWYKRAADGGQINGITNLAAILSDEKSPLKNQIAASNLYRQAAEAGVTYAMELIANRYEKGIGVERNLTTAFNWYKKIAELEVGSFQMMKVAEMYYLGQGTTADKDLAAQWFAKATEKLRKDSKDKKRSTLFFIEPDVKIVYLVSHAQDDDKESDKYYFNGHVIWSSDQSEIDRDNPLIASGSSLFNIAELLTNYNSTLTENGVKKTAQDYYLNAAKLGHVPAMLKLAYYYKNENKTLDQKLANTEALKWFRLAAATGNAEAQNEMGESYFYGKLVKEDYAEAFKWYQKAAPKNVDATYNLAYCYLNGLGIDTNAVEATKLLDNAAKQGNISAMFELAKCYENGNGLDTNVIEAIKWYEKSAQLGYEESQLALGNIYLYNESNKNIADGIKWCTKAAIDYNNKDAMNMLINYYQYNASVKDVEKIMFWNIKLAEIDDEAAINLGLIYQYGLHNTNMPIDLDAAIKWFKKAAEHGNANGMYALGEIYTKANVKNIVLSNQWYKKALEAFKKEAINGSGSEITIAQMYEEGLGTNQLAELIQIKLIVGINRP